MYCKKCGTELSADDKYCKKCGAKIQKKDELVEKESSKITDLTDSKVRTDRESCNGEKIKICRHCGKKIPDGYDFCDYCGWPVSSDRPNTHGQIGHESVIRHSKKKRIAWLVGGLAIVISIASLLYFSLERTNKFSLERTNEQFIQETRVDPSAYSYSPADYQYLTHSDFYDGYAFVGYFKERDDWETYTISMMNKDGLICPLFYNGEAFGGFDASVKTQIIPGINGNPSAILQEKRDQEGYEIYTVNHKRNVMNITELVKDPGRYVTSTNDRLLISDYNEDFRNITRLYLTDYDGNVLQSVSLPKDFYMPRFAYVSDDGKYIVVDGYSLNDKERLYEAAIFSDSAPVIYKMSNNYSSEIPHKAKILCVLGRHFNDDGSSGFVDVLTEEGEIYRLSAEFSEEFVIEPDSLDNNRFFGTSSNGYDRAPVQLRDGQLSVTPFNDLPNNIDFVSFRWMDQGGVIQMIDQDYNYSFLVYDNNSFENGVLCDGFLAENYSETAIEWINNVSESDIPIKDSPYICATDEQTHPVIYDHSGKKVFDGTGYRYIYQYSDNVARTVPESVTWTWEHSDINGSTCYPFTFSESTLNESYRMNDIVYLDEKFEKLFEEIKSPDLPLIKVG